MAKRRVKHTSDKKEAQYPIGTIVYYGPDDKTVTKIVAGVVEFEDADPIMKRWTGTGVTSDPQVLAELGEFFKTHSVNRVVMTNGVVGCPHEEGVDYPAGEDCPYCPYWQSQGQ